MKKLTTRAISAGHSPFTPLPASARCPGCRILPTREAVAFCPRLPARSHVPIARLGGGHPATFALYPTAADAFSPSYGGRRPRSRRTFMLRRRRGGRRSQRRSIHQPSSMGALRRIRTRARLLAVADVHPGPPVPWPGVRPKKLLKKPKKLMKKNKYTTS